MPRGGRPRLWPAAPEGYADASRARGRAAALSETRSHSRRCARARAYAGGFDGVRLQGRRAEILDRGCDRGFAIDGPVHLFHPRQRAIDRGRVGAACDDAHEIAFVLEARIAAEAHVGIARLNRGERLGNVAFARETFHMAR